jgi:3-oxoacyl-[acyl-carrier protein] reductase
MNFAPDIRVNAVAPGIVETNMIKTIPKWRVQEYRENELIKTPIFPEDVANTVAFLLSNESRNYTGSVFDLNNGCYLR